MSCDHHSITTFTWWMRYIKKSDVRWNLCRSLCGECSVDESSIQDVITMYNQRYEAYLNTFEIDVESYWQ